MTAKHTPGPWSVTVRTQREGECDPGIWIRSASTKRTVVDTGAIEQWPLSTADESVIAAAPDLLAAAISAESWLAEWLGSMGPDPMDGGVSGLVLKLRDAIAKAGCQPLSASPAE